MNPHHKNLLITILEYFNMEPELEDFDKIHASIEKDVIFRGTNLWILMFAIVVASVGLNMNSTAVIIGAMLISPLMGPINGMGYSIATYNFPLLKKALKNFSFAVGGSLLASTLYFTISPVSTAHSELLARTSPTIYDVLIALFGGLAGIVAISSRQKGNVIPGVAIATALMPPLCTAGYGLATTQFSFLFGALYLFTINTVFIALSSVLFSKLFKFPIRTIVDAKHIKKTKQLITWVIVITVIPSIYFGYRLVQKENFVTNANNFTQNVTLYEGNYLIKSDISPEKRNIKLVYAGNSFTDVDKVRIKEKALDFNIDSSKVAIEEGISFSEIKSELNERDQLRNEVSRLKTLLTLVESRQDSLVHRNDIGKQLLSEAQIIYPQITSCMYAETSEFYTDGNNGQPLAIAIFTISKKLSNNDQHKISEWLEARLKTSDVKVFFQVEK
jgi:uncharacterized hydrophobic protein (TIGR00271 family)